MGLEVISRICTDKRKKRTCGQKSISLLVGISTSFFAIMSLLLDLWMLYISYPGSGNLDGECQVGFGNFDLSHWMLCFAFIVLSVRVLTFYDQVIFSRDCFKKLRPNKANMDASDFNWNYSGWQHMSYFLGLVRAVMVILQFVVMMAGLLIYVLFKAKVLDDDCDESGEHWITFQIYILLLWGVIITYFTMEIAQKYITRIIHWRDPKEYPFHYLI